MLLIVIWYSHPAHNGILTLMDIPIIMNCWKILGWVIIKNWATIPGLRLSADWDGVPPGLLLCMKYMTWPATPIIMLIIQATSCMLSHSSIGALYTVSSP